MKKADALAIKKLTSSMPPEVEIFPTKYTLTGEDLMLGGYKDLEPNIKYEIDGYGVRVISHEPRIKEAFKRQGIPGVREYVDKVKSKYFGL